MSLPRARHQQPREAPGRNRPPKLFSKKALPLSIDLVDISHMSTESIDFKAARPGVPDPARRVVEALRGLRFGSVEITVHEGRIVQLERREKFRLDRTEEGRPLE